MNRKLVLIMALTLLVGTLSVAFNVQRAKASGTIFSKETKLEKSNQWFFAIFFRI